MDVHGVSAAARGPCSSHRNLLFFGVSPSASPHTVPRARVQRLQNQHQTPRCLLRGGAPGLEFLQLGRSSVLALPSHRPRQPQVLQPLTRPGLWGKSPREPPALPGMGNRPGCSIPGDEGLGNSPSPAGFSFSRASSSPAQPRAKREIQLSPPRFPRRRREGKAVQDPQAQGTEV